MIPGLSSGAVLEGLKSEIPKYIIIAIADGVSMQADKLLWWKNHESELTCWSEACKIALLIQPSSSSAAAERVFSMLSNNFTDRLDLWRTTQKHL